MREKVIDIHPPCEKRSGKISCNKEEKKKCSGVLPLFVLGIFLFFVGYFYYISYRTEIVISPLTEYFEMEEAVLVRSFGSIGEGEIRGIVLSERVSGEREFEVEGRRMLETKTKGEIKVCQSYRDTPAPFVQGTRFISEDGKIFFAEEGFSLPPKGTNDGCAMVKVVAADAGEDYNISADSVFALPGLQGTTIYSDVKGVSFTMKEEGVLKEVPYLDDLTMASAETQMKEELFEKGREMLIEKHGEEYFIDDDNQYILEVAEKNMVEEDVDSDTFSFKLDVTIKVIAINKEDLDSFIEKSLPSGKMSREDTREMKFNFRRINFEDSEADITLSFSADIHQRVDEEEWKRQLLGVDFEQAESALRAALDVEDVTIKTKPFGLNKVANSLSRVDFVLKFDSVD
jgi:hypothetical protein